jgi:hypothetical protein
MAGKGGARPGAGRKPKGIKSLTPIATAEGRIVDRLPQLIDNLFSLADGVTVQEETPQGGPRVYTRPPDRQANEYLINRIMGKPTERKEVSGPEGGPIQVDVSKMSDDELNAIVKAEGGGGT